MPETEEQTKWAN